MSSGLGHSSHPVQLRAIKVVRLCHFCTRHIQSLLALFKEIGIIAKISVDGLVIQFKNVVAHTVQEIPVVCNHQQRKCATREIFLKPFNHLQIQMVGRLVQNQEIRFRNQDVGQRHTFQLSAGKLRQGLFEIRDVQFGKDRLGTCFVVPGPLALHAVQYHLQAGMPVGGHALLILADKIRGVVAMPETSLNHRKVFRIYGLLRQVTHLQTVMIYHIAFVCLVCAGQYVEQRGLSCTVAGNQSHLVSLAYAEAKIREKGAVSHSAC